MKLIVIFVYPTFKSSPLTEWWKYADSVYYVSTELGLLSDSVRAHAKHVHCRHKYLSSLALCDLSLKLRLLQANFVINNNNNNNNVPAFQRSSVEWQLVLEQHHGLVLIPATTVCLIFFSTLGDFVI